MKKLQARAVLTDLALVTGPSGIEDATREMLRLKLGRTLAKDTTVFTEWRHEQTPETYEHVFVASLYTLEPQDFGDMSRVIARAPKPTGDPRDWQYEAAYERLWDAVEHYRRNVQLRRTGGASMRSLRAFRILSSYELDDAPSRKELIQDVTASLRARVSAAVTESGEARVVHHSGGKVAPGELGISVSLLLLEKQDWDDIERMLGPWDGSEAYKAAHTRLKRALLWHRGQEAPEHEEV